MAAMQWSEWEKNLKFREEASIVQTSKTYAEDMEFYKMLQYLFFKQWNSLKAYANEKGIRDHRRCANLCCRETVQMSGQIRSQFYLDEKLEPIEVAGCPPDAFSADGQLWGNPLFRWDVMKADGYTWWTKRIAAMSKIYDVVRIDHFRGFDSYYAIPAKDDTARNGKWKEGPGMDLFRMHGAET